MILRKVAVIKPDHIGDVVLSIPAIRVLSREFQVTLFVASYTYEIAKFLFRDLDIIIREIEFSHLSKQPHKQSPLPSLLEYDLVISLRDDAHIKDYLVREANDWCMTSSSNNIHEAKMHSELVKAFVGDYDPLEHFKVPLNIAKRSGAPVIGLSPSAGYGGNMWPEARWVELAKVLRSRQVAYQWILGPKELPLKPFFTDILGPQNWIDGFGSTEHLLEEISKLNLVVSTDSGLAHLASTVTPILSLFGPSPYKRFAPLGARVLTHSFSCSPCPQFHPQILNLCSSRPCMNSILPIEVMNLIQEMLHSDANCPIDQ